jgi:hypothetical protein
MRWAKGIMWFIKSIAKAHLRVAVERKVKAVVKKRIRMRESGGKSGKCLISVSIEKQAIKAVCNHKKFCCLNY